MSYHWWDRVPKLRPYPVPLCPPTWGWRRASDLSLRQPRMTCEDVDHDVDVRGPFFVFDRVALACQNTSFHRGEESGIPAKPEVSQVLVRIKRWLPGWNWSGLHPSQQDRPFVCGRGRGTQPRATHKGKESPRKAWCGLTDKQDKRFFLQPPHSVETHYTSVLFLKWWNFFWGGKHFEAI